MAQRAYRKLTTSISRVSVSMVTKDACVSETLTNVKRMSLVSMVVCVKMLLVLIIATALLDSLDNIAKLTTMNACQVEMFFSNC